MFDVFVSIVSQLHEETCFFFYDMFTIVIKTPTFCCSFTIEFTLEIRVSEEWDDRLRDKTSDKYKELANHIKEEVY